MEAEQTFCSVNRGCFPNKYGRPWPCNYAGEEPGHGNAPTKKVSPADDQATLHSKCVVTTGTTLLQST